VKRPVGKTEEVQLHKRRSLTLKKKLDIIRLHPDCPVCRQKLDDLKDVEFDHWVVPLAIGGSNEQENFRGLHVECHKQKTKQDRKVIAKVERLRKKRFGLTRSKKAIPARPFPKRKRAFERANQQGPDRRRKGDAEPEEG
jgi:5-methylcytosine-specific restriction enzyme A